MLIDDANESLARERVYFAFRTMRAYLDELEIYVGESKLFREPVCATLEAQSRQLDFLVRVYEQARSHRDATGADYQPPRERVL